MKKVLYNDNWEYWPENDAFALIWKKEAGAKPVTLPHDAMLDTPAHAGSINAGNTGYRDGGVYYYSKEFFADETMKDQTIMLLFEGIYMNAQVYVNTQLAGHWAYGYTGFYVKLNDFLNYGKSNEIRVIVRNSAGPNSRWYSGSGIYRDAWLFTAPKCYIRPDGCMIRTESVEGCAIRTESMEGCAIRGASAKVSVKTAVVNDSSAGKKGKISFTITGPDGSPVCKSKLPFSVPAEAETIVETAFDIKEPSLWSENSPSLYTLKASLVSEDALSANASHEEVLSPDSSREEVLSADSSGDETLFTNASQAEAWSAEDSWTETFGIRTMTCNAANGLLINGESVKLRGACIHHDSGMLGARTFYDFHYRQIKLLKEAGYNAIRMAHHPAAPALLRACDELGMYVMDETFDMWTRCKTANDYALYFDKWWEADVEAMVRKDFNHPSVILYSIGNEIPEIGTPFGARLAAKINRKIKEFDDTRFTLASINGLFAIGDHLSEVIRDILTPQERESMTDPQGNVNDFMASMIHAKEMVTHPYMSERLADAVKTLDIAGYNYMTARYEFDRTAAPDRVIVGSETYPGAIAENWKYVKKYPSVLGDFVWTGWDYLGESGVGIPTYGGSGDGFGTPYPCQMSYSGNTDITGFRKPVSYYTEIVLGFRKNPYIAVQNPVHFHDRVNKTPWSFTDALPDWTYPGCEGMPAHIEVYSAGDEVELLLNGKSLGKKAAGQEAGFLTRFDTEYIPGNLEAVSYENGIEIGRFTLSTAGKERRLVTSIEKGPTGKLTFLTLEIQDEKGVLVYKEDREITASITGDADLYIGSGSHSPLDNYIDGKTKTWNGRAQIVVVKKDPADIVTVHTEGMDIQI